MNTRYISPPLVALIVSLILYPAFAHEKAAPDKPPQDPKQKPPPQKQKPPPQDPKQKPPQNPPQENQKPTPLHDRYKGHFSAVYAFGDSYTDTGNAQFLGGLTMSFSGSLSSPYGSTTFGETSNRLCDGRLVLDFVTDSLGLSTLPPYQSTSANFSSGVNFAIAGATSLVGDSLAKLARTFMCKGPPMGVRTQIDWFKKFHIEHICKGMDPQACTTKLSTALFWVGEIGINDYSRAVGSTLSLRAIAESSVTNTCELVLVRIENNIPMTHGSSMSRVQQSIDAF